MRIVHLSPSLLTLRLRPVWLWIFGGMFVATGSAIAIFAQVTTLSCTRIEPTNCQLVASGLLGSKSKEIPLNIMQGAKVEENNDGDGGNTYRVVILTSSGEVPFTSNSSSGESEKQAITSHIKNFISNPAIASLTEKQDDRFSMYLFGGIFVTAGLITLLARVVTCVFDKTEGKLTLKRQGFFGTKVIEHRLSEIKDVLVEESTNSDGSTSRVSIVLVSGSLPLTSYYSSGKNRKLETASYIRSFLNLGN